ncbi:MAG: hypothetical protein EIB84_05105 [Spiroplasma poulsonii]|uniref:Lipoprotein n=2 Tax=Spiroplasma poulsonii TaxID=2138 RepID=A0A2P6FCR3_9MOLU|nr:hypothetical protein [Spiroplasma poulsonii]KAF0851624.1 putative lipoprotein [Spiroplasma poulsonii]MBW1242177.1 hypothetical protein [Spiroplasma poulsonii]PQM31222.1 hypothetical protein SMSRO_SF010360 [Spiroplasma poulsonii]PWF96225.1 hypothetical protein SMSE_16720 [Spiroplasma poulsonii]PWF99000.1 hypothetical protein SMH99_15720 [Spiroplasma poulsonii]
MKKLLALLGISAFTVTGASTIVSCHRGSDSDDSNTGAAKDAETLNKISQRISNAFLEYARTRNTINSKDYQPTFDELYTMVDKTTQSKALDQNDPKVVGALQILKTSFMAVFNNVNQQIINDYSNYYIDTKPIDLSEDSLKYNLNFIDTEKLAKLANNPAVKDVKATRLDFSFSFKVNFKNLATTSNYFIQYVITDDPKTMGDVLRGVVEKLSKVIVKFFVKEGTFQIDKTPGFEEIYNDFNVNYTQGFRDLDNIILAKLKKAIAEDSDSANLVGSIKYNDSLTLLTLLTSAINNSTNGVDLVTEKTASYVWAGMGYQPDKITPENFVTFYRSLVNIFNTGHNSLNLAYFNVNLSKMLVAGFPLLGAVMNGGEALKVQVEITKDGLDKKLLEYGKLVTAFYKHFRLESNKNSGVWHLSESAFNKILALPEYKYQKVLRILIDDFKASSEAKGLSGLDIFTTGDWKKRGHDVTLNDTKDTFSLRRGTVWNFDLTFGTNNAVYYTGWTSTLFTLQFTKK